MRSDIVPGGTFPDYALPDHTGTVRTLSELQGRDPLILTLARGNYCPKEHRQHLELAENYAKIAVAYTQMATIATDDHHTLQEFRASVGAQWPFLSDPERIVQKDLDIQEYTDPEHDPMIPHTLVLKPGLVIHSVYNGYWFWGRPSFYDLWHDLRAATAEIRPDWDLSTPGLREAWDAGDYSKFHGWDRRSPGSNAELVRRAEQGVNAMRTPVCELLGIEQPIVLAPMVAVPPLAAAVSNAGALGMVTLTWSEDVGAVVRETAALTERPFCGNLVLTEDRHRRLDQALEAGLRIVSFFLGDPSGYIEQVHDAGGIVLHTVGTAEEARRAVASGVDVVVAQGWEAGGHVWGNVATLPLVPAVVDAVAPVPVIAAGGIGDARGVAAVLALGAQAAWLGTRFLLAEEMPIHEDYRRRLIAAAETDPQRYPNLYSVGWPDSPHRALRNSTADTWQAAGRPPLAQRPGAGDVIAHFASGEPIVRYEPAPPMAGTTGDIEALSMWAGQGVALAKKSQPAADIVTELTSHL